MIEITNKAECCGCEACVQRCPRHCISLRPDDEGFLYPHVDLSLCIDCHLCEKSCPIVNAPKADITPVECYAAKNPDSNVRHLSSSGGVFTLLAQKTILEGGVVFGARFNENWEVIHGYSDTLEGINAFRGSKYVQSHIAESFILAGKVLKEGRKVLFSGTPCQIAGLRRYLGKEYSNLLTVDFICHGVPSPGVFSRYLEETTGNKDTRITDIQFRDKTKGWAKSSLSISYLRNGREKSHIASVDRDKYLIGFVKDLYLRPSCHECRFKNLRSGADITMGDFWGISSLHPELNDDKGISAIMVNTAKGTDYFNKILADKFPVSYSDIRARNIAVSLPAKLTENRRKFFTGQTGTVYRKVNIIVPQSLKTKVKHITEDAIVFCLGESAFKRIKKIL